MKKLLLIFVFTILSSCTIEVVEQDCGVVSGRTEGLDGNIYYWYITIYNDRGVYETFEVDSDTYYSSYIGEYICLR